MNDERGGWNNFKRIKMDKKAIARRMKRMEGMTHRHLKRHVVGRFENIRDAKGRVFVWLAVVAVMTLAVGLQMMLYSSNYSKSAPSVGGTYAEGVQGAVDTLNPLYASTSAEASASRLLFSSLYSYDTSGHLHTDAATDMKIDDSGKVYTIGIRNDVRWHDGTRLTADDVIFTLNLIKNPETRSPLRINWQDVSAQKVDDYMIRFNIPAVYAAFPYALTFPILPKHVLETVRPVSLRENPYSQAPVGSGPFKFRLLQGSDITQSHKVVHMVANDDYYLGRVKLNRFELHAYPSQDEIVKAVRIGEVTGATDISMADARQISNDAYKVVTKPINNGMYMIFNMNNPILSNIQVRRALQVGTDTQAIRDKLGKHIPALDLPFVNGQLSGSDIPRAPAVDTTKAASLLDAAGWKSEAGQVRKKDGQALTLTITTTKDSQTDQVLEVIKEQWSKLGIDLKTNVVDTSQPGANFFPNVLQPRNYDILLYELLIGADPDVFAYWHSSQMSSAGYNFANYADKAADASLASARSRLEPELRSAKYKTFASQWLEAVPAIGLYQQVMNYAVNKNVESVSNDQKTIAPVDRYDNILYWTVEDDDVYKTP